MTHDERTPDNTPAQPAPRRARLWSIAIALLLILIFSLHIKATFYGAPHPCAYSSDEYDVISRAVQMARGDLLPIHASKPTAYNFCVTAVLGGDFVLRHFLCGLTTADFQKLFFTSPFSFTWLARMVSVLATMGTLLLLLWGLRRFDGLTRFGALLLLGLGCASTFGYGHWAKEDAFATFWVMVSFVAANELWQTPPRLRRRVAGWLALSAAGAGMALSSKYNCLPVLLFPLIAGARAFAADRRVKTFCLLAFLIAAPLLIAFAIGTPYAVLHPAGFIARSLASPVARQASGSFLYVHNIGKTDLAFLGVMLCREYIIAVAFAVIAALILMLCKRGGTPSAPFALWGTYAAAYLLMLSASSQLDYQYILMLSPVLVFAVTPTIFRYRSLTVVTVAALLLINPLFPFSPARAHNGLALDQAADGARLEQLYSTMVPTDRADKPILVFSPFFFRYWPWIAPDAASYERLRAQAIADGGSGSWFEHAARYAESGTGRKFAVHFLDIKTAFTVDKNGRRHFEQQPFDTDIGNYAGRYSLFIIPQTTVDLVKKDIPELRPLNEFVRAALSLPAPAEAEAFNAQIRSAN